jgi:lipopolysaccharide export system permease protein
MEGVLIYDRREKERVNTIFAKEGLLASNPESQEVVLRLLDGEIHRFEPQKNVYQKMKFDTYDLKLEIGKAFAAWGARLREKEMSIDEIKKKIEMKKKLGEDTTDLEIEFHKRYAIPFACIVFGLIGVPLGIQPRRSGRSYGFILSIFIILAYYISLTIFEVFGEKKTISVFLAGWAPNFLFGGLGIYLLIKTAKESPFKPLIWLKEALDFIKRKWNGFFRNV